MADTQGNYFIWSHSIKLTGFRYFYRDCRQSKGNGHIRGCALAKEGLLGLLLSSQYWNIATKCPRWVSKRHAPNQYTEHEVGKQNLTAMRNTSLYAYDYHLCLSTTQWRHIRCMELMLHIFLTSTADTDDRQAWRFSASTPETPPYPKHDDLNAYKRKRTKPQSYFKLDSRGKRGVTVTLRPSLLRKAPRYAKDNSMKIFRILYPATRWRRTVSLTPKSTFYPRGKRPRFPLDRRGGGRQRERERERSVMGVVVKRRHPTFPVGSEPWVSNTHNSPDGKV